MSPPPESDNAYISELKSLLKDKFFMMLLGISVAIVILSTFYSFIRPKSTGPADISAQSASTEMVTPTLVAKADTVDTEKREVMKAAVSPTTVAKEAVLPTKGEENVFLGLDTALSVDESNQPNFEISPTEAPSKSFMDRLRGIFGGSADPEVTSTPAADMVLEPTVSVMAEKTVTKPALGKEYTVAEGDNLWDIAERAYGSGYNYVDIASASKLEDMDNLAVGQKLTIPSVKAKDSTVIGSVNGDGVSTKNPSSIPATYTVVQGDSLWNIATTQYNNAYEWTKIATLNNLSYPDYIEVGQVLKLK